VEESFAVRRTNRLLQSLLVLMLSALLIPCSKADSTVRVHMIDARSGVPVANEPVRLWTLDVAEYRNHPGYVEQNTDSSGVASFHLTGPTPAYLYIHIGMNTAWDECSANSRSGYIGSEVLASGISAEGLCGKLPNIAGKFHPSPGDVYIFVVHDTFSERLKKPLD